MKNTLKRIPCIVCALLLSSCGSSNHSFNDSQTNGGIINSQSTSSESSDSSLDIIDYTLYDISDVNTQLKNSKPTQVITVIKYKYPKGNFNVELEFSSVLSIEYVDNQVKAKYTAAKQKINDSLDGDMIITEKNTYYTIDSDYGILNNGEIIWNQPYESNFSNFNMIISDAYFDDKSYEITDNTFKGNVKTGYEKSFIGYDVTSLNLNLKFNNGVVSNLTSSFVTSESATVSLTCSYSYNKIKVDIPA